ncbi:Plasmid maintenance system antidote protein [Candidatus Methylomirabilis lanthanidiphila]|uniref:Plasmid maintenance system antidote protein n=1 Tax=Candidatus Methylomirabilis lanthanidiphila TaxID=2211376 RepID=A0A564ZFY0_9BACT|nr:Plasmid maintenance system antidote protein [Candidatus Methylomirabilis lanthanidiphila]
MPIRSVRHKGLKRLFEHDGKERTAISMKNPPHPGGVIRRQVIEPLGLSITNAADILGVTRQTLSLLLNERTDLSSEMALRVEKAFGPKMDHLMKIRGHHTHF